jgi:hypothetical protein
MITESFHPYKGYVIRLRAVTDNGFGFSIIKEVPNATSPGGIKKLYLREKRYAFTNAEALMKEAINYIDNHESNLIQKINKLTSKIN